MSREFKSIFKSPLFLATMSLVGFIWSYVFLRSLHNFEQQIHSQTILGTGDLQFVIKAFMSAQYLLFLILCPMVAMKVISEDKQNGVLNYLHTLPISSATLLVGKFLGGLSVLTMILLISLVYPLGIAAPVSFSKTLLFSSFLGLWFLILIFYSVSYLVAIASRGAAITFAGGFVLNLCFLMFTDLGFFVESPVLKNVIKQMSSVRHFSAMLDGSIHLESVVFFISVAVMCLILADRIFKVSRWQQ